MTKQLHDLLIYTNYFLTFANKYNQCIYKHCLPNLMIYIYIINTNPLFESVSEAGVTAPCHTLIVRQATGALSLEVEQALVQSITVFMLPGYATPTEYAQYHQQHNIYLSFHLHFQNI